MKLKRIVSMVLVILLLLSLCPVSAFATESTEESSTEVTESTEPTESTEATEATEATETPETSMTLSFVDEFEDFSKIHSYSNNHGGWGLNTNTISGIDDTTHIQRNVTELDASEDITYYLPNLQDFKLTVAAHANSYGTINLYTSPDGETWTNQAYTVTGTLHWNWAPMVLTPAEGVNAGANYLKIEVAAHPTKTWGIQLGRFEATLAHTFSETTSFVDECTDFNKVYSCSNNYGGWSLNTSTMNGIGSADTTHFSKAVTDVNAVEYVIYYLPNLQDFKLTVACFGNSYGIIKLYTSPDGETWTEQAYTNSGTLSAQWAQIVFTPTDGVNAGANYLKIEFGYHFKTWGIQLGRGEAVWSEDAVPTINSAKMVDDALVVTFDPVKDANSYTVDLAVDGNVVKSVQTGKTTCNIYGVTPGTTYVATVTAHTGTSDSVASKGVSVTIPETTSFVDECTDFNKVYSRSNNYGGWSLNTSTMNGIGSADTTHFSKAVTDVNAVEYVIYYLPNLQDFKLTVACFGNSYGIIKLYTSPDGETWTEQAYTNSGTLSAQWAQIAFTPTDGVNVDANYLKIEFGYHFKTWGIQLGRVEATLGVDFVDEFEDFSKLHSYSNNHGGWNLNTSAITGISDTTHISRNVTELDASEDITYYLPDLQYFKLTVAAHANSYGTINLYTSPDGETWTNQAYTVTGTLHWNWAPMVLTPAEGVNAGANYLKIEVAAHPTKTWGIQLGQFEAMLGSTVEEKLANTIALIDAIGTVTVDSGDAIEAARAEYDALPENQKAKVSNYAVLTQAEERYAALSSSKVESWNLILGDDIGLNFLISTKEAYVDQTYVHITVGDEEPVSYKVSELTPEENGYYLISVNVAAAQMTENVKLQTYVGDLACEAQTYTVAQYAQILLADESMSTYYTLVKEMLNYGAAAQTYFSYNTENTIDETLYTGAGANEVNSEGVADIAVSDSVDGISFYGATMVFRSKTAVRFYFTVDGDIGSYTFKLGDQVLNATAKDGMYYVEAANINPQDLDEALILTVVNGEEVWSISYSPMNYIVRMSEKGSDNLKAALKAMYNYHLAAKDLIENV